MEKAAFLRRIAKSRDELEAAISRLTTKQLLEPGASGEMSVKDMLAHITWHEREMIGVIEQMALVGSPWWELPTDARNALIYSANHERSWEDIRMEAEEVYPRLVIALSGLDEAAYTDATCFREMPPDWLPRQVFAGNTFEHYEHHLKDIRSFFGSEALL